MEIRHDDLAPPREYLAIEVDPAGMRGIAAALWAELTKNYVPHRDRVDADMVVPTAAPASDFAELLEFLTRHNESQQLITALLAEHGNATASFAAAAELISDEYGDADKRAAARAGGA